MVNMSPLELEKWLETKTTHSPAAESPESELIIDAKLSKKLIKILLKRKFMLTNGDYECLEKITNHINQLYKHKPAENLPLSSWRYALMNLGHDPLKASDN